MAVTLARPILLPSSFIIPVNKHSEYSIERIYEGRKVSPNERKNGLRRDIWPFGTDWSRLLAFRVLFLPLGVRRPFSAPSNTADSLTKFK